MCSVRLDGALYRLQRVRAASVGPRYNTRAATFLDIDDPWTNYFTAIAGASGAIFALLFVGMQVRLDVWRGNLLRIYAVALALFELAVPLIISVIVLMPQDTWQTGARIVGPIGVCAAIGHVLMYLRVRRAVTFDHQRRHRLPAWIPSASGSGQRGPSSCSDWQLPTSRGIAGSTRCLSTTAEPWRHVHHPLLRARGSVLAQRLSP